MGPARAAEVEGRALLGARPRKVEGPLPREAEPLNLRRRGDPFSQLSRTAAWLTEWTWLDRFTPAVIRLQSVLLAPPASYSPGSVPSEHAEALLPVDVRREGAVMRRVERRGGVGRRDETCKSTGPVPEPVGRDGAGLSRPG